MMRQIALVNSELSSKDDDDIIKQVKFDKQAERTRARAHERERKAVLLF